MRNILFISLLLATIISSGECCHHKQSRQKKTISCTATNEVWMRYDETKCDNPWNFNWFMPPTEAQITAAIKGDLQGKSIEILQLTSYNDTGLVSCETCNCPNGRHIFVQVRKSESEKLKAMKFYEVKEVPNNVNTYTPK